LQIGQAISECTLGLKQPALGDIHAALSLLGEELKAGYQKIRDAL